jgi:hypothetical protein
MPGAPKIHLAVVERCDTALGAFPSPEGRSGFVDVTLEGAVRARRAEKTRIGMMTPRL